VLMVHISYPKRSYNNRGQ